MGPSTRSLVSRLSEGRVSLDDLRVVTVQSHFIPRSSPTLSSYTNFVSLYPTVTPLVDGPRSRRYKCGG